MAVTGVIMKYVTTNLSCVQEIQQKVFLLVLQALTQLKFIVRVRR